MSSIYTTGSDVDVVREAARKVLRYGFDVEEAPEYSPYTIAIDLVDLYDCKVVARRLSGELRRRVATMAELDAELEPA